MSRFYQSFIGKVRAHDDSAGVEVIIERLGFAKEFRAEDDILRAHFFPDSLRITYGNGGLDDHNGIRIIFHHQFDDCFHGRSIEEILLTVIVGRRSDDHHFRLFVSSFRIEGGREVQFLFCQIHFDIVILDR